MKKEDPLLEIGEIFKVQNDLKDEEGLELKKEEANAEGEKKE